MIHIPKIVGTFALILGGRKFNQEVTDESNPKIEGKFFSVLFSIMAWDYLQTIRGYSGNLLLSVIVVREKYALPVNST